jgi:sugar-specific transcriptional regulator TrmB
LSEDLERVLSELGLSEKEAKVYLYLAKNGPQKASEISKNLKIHKVEVYRFLKYLENKTLVESALERPTRFSALPFEQALDSLIAERKKTTLELEEKRNTILDQWKLLEVDKIPVTSERFLVLLGRTNVYLKIMHLMKQTQKEFQTIMTNFSFFTDQTKFVPQGLEEVLREKRNRQIYARIICEIDEDHLDETQSYNQKLQRKHLLAEIRHLDLGKSFIPRLVLRDEEEAVVFLTPKRHLMLGKEETGLWTNSKAVVYALKALFEELWQDSQPLAKRIEELRIHHIDH